MEEILRILNKYDCKELKAQSIPYTYSISKKESLKADQVSNRSSATWKKANFIIIEDDIKSEDIEGYLTGWKSLASYEKNQILIIKTNDSLKCYNYEGNIINDNIENIIRKYRIKPETKSTNKPQDKKESTQYNNYLHALKTKPFMLLAGISGTGKSRIVREMAFMSCPKELQDQDGTMPGNYCMVEVKPNWHDSTELLGYYSNIRGKYIFTPFVKFLIKAMKYSEFPFFVCLDEMNLAPVEQYFAEFLSVLETRKVCSGNKILTAPLIKKDYFSFLKDLKPNPEYKNDREMEAKSIAKELELDEDDYESIRVELTQKGLTLPDNVFVIGTVNMDDTTCKFSRKVIDRAMTIEMNGGKLHEMFGNSEQLQYRDDIVPLYAFKPQYVTADDAIERCIKMESFHNQITGPEDDAQSLSGRLKAINDCLDGTPFQVSYRVLNELVIYLAVLIDNEDGDITQEHFETLLNTAIDDITLMKILPRIEGDYEMFECRDANGAIMGENKLEMLLKVVPANGKSYNKIVEMNNRLNRSSFTRFWP